MNATTFSGQTSCINGMRQGCQLRGGFDISNVLDSVLKFRVLSIYRSALNTLISTVNEFRYIHLGEEVSATSKVDLHY